MRNILIFFLVFSFISCEKTDSTSKQMKLEAKLKIKKVGDEVFLNLEVVNNGESNIYLHSEFNLRFFKKNLDDEFDDWTNIYLTQEPMYGLKTEANSKLERYTSSAVRDSTINELTQDYAHIDSLIIAGTIELIFDSFVFIKSGEAWIKDYSLNSLKQFDGDFWAEFNYQKRVSGKVVDDMEIEFTYPNEIDSYYHFNEILYSEKIHLEY